MAVREPLLTDDRLHAYADRRLPPEEAAAVERALAADPEAMARVAAWRDQNAGLHALFDPVAEEPLPPRLAAAVEGVAALPRRRPVLRALGGMAAGLALLAAGAAGGWIAHDRLSPAPDFPHTLAEAATAAHVVYAAEPRHAVEVGAEEEHLFRWLSARLGGDATAPPLSELGFELAGGRLLPFGDGHAAQYLYEDASGRRLTLYLTRSDGRGPTSFRWEREGEIGAFYWIEGDFGYALIGALPREDLLRAARIVYGAVLG